MLQRQVGSTGPIEAANADKENILDPSDRIKTPRTGLKMAAGGQRSGQASPAASPSAKKMKVLTAAGKAVASPMLKSGLRDITNSAVKQKTVTIITNTDSVAPRLLEGKKRSPPSLLIAHATAPPSKLQIMNTASELDLSSLADSQLPDIEYAPEEPERKAGECSDEDFFEQYDFTYLTQLTATSFPGDCDVKKNTIVEQFESELSSLSIDSLDEDVDCKDELHTASLLD